MYNIFIQSGSDKEWVDSGLVQDILPEASLIAVKLVVLGGPYYLSERQPFTTKLS